MLHLPALERRHNFPTKGFQKAEQQHRSWEILHHLLALVSDDPENQALELITDQLLDQFGLLSTICRSTREQLEQVHGMTDKMISILLIQPNIPVVMAEEKLIRRNVLRSESDFKDYIQQELAYEDSIYGLVLYLNHRHHLIRTQRLFRGSLSKIAIFPREIAKNALACRARGVVTAINIPEGVDHISINRQGTFERIRAALETIEVKYHHHFTVNSTGVIKDF